MKPALLRIQTSRLVRSVLVTGLLSLAASLLRTGCRVVSTTASVPERTVKVFFPGGKSNQPDAGDLQQRLMRFADSYNEAAIKEVDQLIDVPGSPFTREVALRFKITTTGGFVPLATVENPYATLLDMVSATT